jgi:hypothetical protein
MPFYRPDEARNPDILKNDDAVSEREVDVDPGPLESPAVSYVMSFVM